MNKAALSARITTETSLSGASARDDALVFLTIWARWVGFGAAPPKPRSAFRNHNLRPQSAESTNDEATPPKCPNGTIRCGPSITPRDGIEAALHYTAGERLLHFPGAAACNPTSFVTNRGSPPPCETCSPPTRSAPIVLASSAFTSGIYWSTPNSTGVGAHPLRAAS